MTETRSLNPSAKHEVPAASDFTSSPLRNRIRLELEAPVSEVWELIGRALALSRVQRGTRTGRGGAG